MTTLPYNHVTELRTVAGILASGTLDGYAQRAPSALSQAVDSALCSVAVCDACGFVGLTYAPFTHPITESYRIIAACRRCGQAVEM